MDSKLFPSLPSKSLCSSSFCVGSPTDMRAMSPSECDQCVSECDAKSCSINLEKEQCTDRCLVVPCEQECLDACDTCFDPPQIVCDSHECPGFAAGHSMMPVVSGDSDSMLPPRRSSLEYNYPHLDWSSAPEDIEAFLCACNGYNHQFQRESCPDQYTSPNQMQIDSHGSYATSPFHPSHSLEQTSTPSSPASALFSPVLTSNSSTRSTPDISPGNILHTSTPNDIQPHLYPDESGDRCLWRNCGLVLPSSEDLTNHLTTDHLSQHFCQYSQQPPEPFFTVDGSQEKIPCLWNNCNIYPSVAPIPTDSGPDSFEAHIESLLKHIQQDHIGIPHLPVQTVQSSHDGETSPDSFIGHKMPQYESPPKPEPGQQPEFFCRWRSCPLAAVPFASPAELTQHLADVHVGMGSSRYHCYWGDCHRHGDCGFSSKQKILRHIQSHTGYRPFKCELCDQHFSEAATLQQHMRRHTKEKPFICPEPGCGKAFAIAGALTIHRRVHTGSKPFKCKYCDRSFSESSNLSKHIRTHTGDRPYSCNYPGCDKRFARPDQVNRHRNTHEKKKLGGTEKEE